MTKAVSFGIIGSGWRAGFYLRAAQALPQRFAACGLVSRSPEKRAAVTREWDVPCFADMDDLLAHGAPDFLVISVNRQAAPAVIARAVSRGLPVLTETPPAGDMEGLLALHRLAKAGAIIHVAEQYPQQPMHAARLAVARSGALGTIEEAQVSFSHGYHGVGMIRALLGVNFENARIRAFRYPTRFVAGPGRDGLPADEQMKEANHDIALFDFDGKLGVYDFAADQHRSYARSPRILVRGDRGEINGHAVHRVEDFRLPLCAELTLRQTGLEGNLEGFFIRGVTLGEKWVYRNPFAPARLTEEEIAVAACLQGMTDMLAGQKGGYPLAQGLQDRYLDQMMEDAIRSGGEVVTATQPWAE